MKHLHLKLAQMTKNSKDKQLQSARVSVSLSLTQFPAFFVRLCRFCDGAVIWVPRVFHKIGARLLLENHNCAIGRPIYGERRVIKRQLSFRVWYSGGMQPGGQARRARCINSATRAVFGKHRPAFFLPGTHESAGYRIDCGYGRRSGG